MYQGLILILFLLSDIRFIHIFKRGDRVWVKVYNERNGSFTSRMAEVISILQMYVSGADVPYVALRYLDDRSYGCIPYEQVTEVCDESFSE